MTVKELSERQFEPSTGLRNALSHIGHASMGRRSDALQLLQRLIREARLRTRRPLVLVVDGLEKLSTTIAHEVALRWRPLAREAALIATVAPSAVLGPEARALVADLSGHQRR